MKRLFFLSMAAIAMLFAGCNENEPDAAPGDNSYTTNNTNNNNAPSVVNGQLSGAFSISATEKVHFSQGNLQYNAVQNTWRFAENQYDTIGKVANQQIASDYDGYIDLFGWATSGYNNKDPWKYGGNPSEYGDGTNSISNTDYDWGTHNAISNGGNMTHLWRTLTWDEWLYIFHGRSNFENLFSLGSVNGIKGLILLPDDWNLPNGATFNPSTSNGLTWKNSNYYENSTYGANNYSDNAYLTSDGSWQKMETAGAVFLPAAGCRESYIYGVGSLGSYWCSTPAGTHGARYLHFNSTSIDLRDGSNRDNGYSVRLVR